MDPNATLRDFWRHMADSNLEEAFYSLTSLIAWIERGGVIPEGLPLDRENSIDALRLMRRSVKVYSVHLG